MKSISILCAGTEMVYEKYVGDILEIQQEAGNLDNPAKVVTKKLFFLLKHSKQDKSGITSISLQANGKALTSDADKAKTLNNQFQSVFSPKSPTTLNAIAPKNMQDLHDAGIKQPVKSSPHTKMPDIQISTKGIECLLKKLNPHKVSGPDKLKSIVLQTCTKN